MADMIAFSLAVMDGLADFLNTEPISYLWVLVLALFVIRIFKALT